MHQQNVLTTKQDLSKRKCQNLSKRRFQNLSKGNVKIFQKGNVKIFQKGNAAHSTQRMKMNTVCHEIIV